MLNTFTAQRFLRVPRCATRARLAVPRVTRRMCATRHHTYLRSAYFAWATEPSSTHGKSGQVLWYCALAAYCAHSARVRLRLAIMHASRSHDMGSRSTTSRVPMLSSMGSDLFVIIISAVLKSTLKVVSGIFPISCLAARSQR
jgi:hypothetical protein